MLRLGAPRNSPSGGGSSNLIQTWTDDDAGAPGTIVETERWLPRPFLTDADGGESAELVYFAPEGEGGVLHIHRRTPDHGFEPAADWSGRLDHAASLWARDVDDDGRFDLIAGTSETADATTLRVFRNRGGTFVTTEPDQILKFAGYGVEPHLVDVDGDGKTELLVESYSLASGNIVKGGTVVRTVLVYTRDAARPFGQRPVSRLDETFSARDAKALRRRISFDADVVGSGGRQAIHTDAEGALVARAFDASRRLEETPVWRFVPGAAILDVAVASLNRDRRSDFLLRHVRSLTILVSR